MLASLKRDAGPTPTLVVCSAAAPGSTCVRSTVVVYTSSNSNTLAKLM